MLRNIHLLLFLAVLAANAEDQPMLRIGMHAPPLIVKTWITSPNEASPKSNFEMGKIYVVEFWRIHCGGCRTCMPHIADVQNKFRDNGVKVISLADETAEDLKIFFTRSPLTDEAATKKEITYGDIANQYTIALDSDVQNFNAYCKAIQQEWIPQAFIVGKTGILEWVGDPTEMDPILTQLVDDKWDRAAFAKKFDAERNARSELQALVEKNGGISSTLFSEIDLNDRPVTDLRLKELSENKAIKDLEKFHLNNTLITDESLKYIGKMSQLTELELTNTKITDVGIASLRDLDQLESFSADGCALGDKALQTITRWPKLKKLSLRNNNISDVGAALLNNLSKIEQILLNENPITNAAIDHLPPTIRYLGLSKTQLTNAGLAKLNGLKNLYGLDLGYLPVSDEGVRTLDLTKLTALYLQKTGITDNFAPDLAKMEHLVDLSLADTEITDVTLRQLKDIKSITGITLDNTNITDEGIKLLASLHLDDLSLNGTAVTGSGVSVLCNTQCPAFLFLNRTNVSDDLEVGLTDILCQIELEDTRITDVGVRKLKSAKRLRYLSLSGTKITDYALMDIGEIGTLLSISMARTNVSDQGIFALSNLKMLDFIRLDKTAVSDSVLPCLSHMESLRRVSLKDTKITEAGRRSVAEESPRLIIQEAKEPNH